MSALLFLEDRGLQDARGARTNPAVDWNPETNDVRPTEAQDSDAQKRPSPNAPLGAKEPDTRYAMLLATFVMAVLPQLRSLSIRTTALSWLTEGEAIIRIDASRRSSCHLQRVSGC